MDTKQSILQTGAEIIHLKGYHATGLQEILNAAKVPKGSFYNYFRSKEDFGLQVIDYFSEFFSDICETVLKDTTRSPLERLGHLLDQFMTVFDAKHYTCGCPVGNLAQEMGDTNPAFREKLSSAIDTMVNYYTFILTEAQKQGEIKQDLDARETANFIVASWHGALIRMKVSKSLAPLKNHKHFILDYILKA